MSVRNNIPGDESEKLFEGDSKRLLFVVEDVVDLTGYTAIFAAFYDDDERIRLDVIPTEIELNGNEVLVKLQPSHTRNKSGSYYYELQVSSPTSDIHTVSYGTLTISGDKAQ